MKNLPIRGSSFLVLFISIFLFGTHTRGATQFDAPQSGGKLSAPAAATATSVSSDSVAPEVQRAVDNAIKERLKDSKVVDMETSEAIAARLSGWAKLFAYFVGVPLAVLAATLGILGLRTFKDFSSSVAQARTEILERFESSRREAEKIAQDFKDLRAKLAESEALASEVQKLSQKVARIEDVVRFKPSSSLTPALKQDLNETLQSYYRYLKTVGLSLSLKPPTVLVDPKDLNAYYIPDPENRIVLHPELASFPDVALREFNHHVLSSVNPEWIKGSDLAGLESGLADYLASSFLDHSDFGRDAWLVFQKHSPGILLPDRNLNNNRSFSELQGEPDKYQFYGTVWGGAFWELRELFGREATDKLLLATWKECDVTAAEGKIDIFPSELLRQDKGSNRGKHAAKIRQVFLKRGLSL